MNDLVLKVKRFLESEDGPTAVEYGVLLALIIAVTATVVKNLGTTISGTFSSVSSSMAS